MKHLDRKVAAVVVAIVAMFLPIAADALVTSSTTVNFPADGAVLKSGALASVSCYAASKCVAVGNYRSDTDALVYPVVVRFDGSTAVSTKGSYTNGLGYSGNTGMTSVDCAPNSAGICWAVGNENFPKSNENIANAQSFIVRLTATTWEPTRVGTGTFPWSSLSKVSCWTATQCALGGTLDGASGSSRAAVGFSDNGNVTLAVLDLSEGLPNTTVAKLQDISCVSRTACLVVGRYYSGSEVKYFTSSFDGTRWVTQKLTLPSDALPQDVTFENAYAVRVSCTESAGCLIVGKYRGQYGYYYGFYGATSSVQGVVVTQKIADTTYIQETDKSYFQISDVDCVGSLSCFITTGGKPLQFKNSVMAYAESGTTSLNNLGAIDCTDDSNCVGLLGSQSGIASGVPAGLLGSITSIDFSKSPTPSTAIPSVVFLKVTKTATAKSFADYSKLTVAKTSTVSLKVATASKRYCAVVSTKVKGVTTMKLTGLRKGPCTVTVTVTPKRGSAKRATVSLRII